MKSPQTLEEAQMEAEVWRRTFNDLADDLVPILLAHMAGNRDEVARQLDGLLRKVQIEVIAVAGAAGPQHLH